MAVQLLGTLNHGFPEPVVPLVPAFANLRQQIGYETIRGGASAAWLCFGAGVLVLAALSALLLNRRLPG